MPKSGQLWEPALLSTSPLLNAFETLSARWLTRTTWPSLDDFTHLAEEQRRQRAPEVSALCFAPAAPKRSRARRDSPLDPARLYDGSIALSGRVPCLAESYHDLFNALVWAAFPRAKRALHARQFRAMSNWLTPGSSRLPNKRTREQDALTVFDEGGSVLVMGHKAWAALDERPKPCLLESNAHSSCGEQAHFVLFGHALMEHVAYGRQSVRSAALLLTVPEPVPTGLALLDLVDRGVAARLLDDADFTAPGADTGVEVDATGKVWLGTSPGADTSGQATSEYQL